MSVPGLSLVASAQCEKMNCYYSIFCFYQVTSSWEQPSTEDIRTSVAPLFPDALPNSPLTCQHHGLSTAAETTPNLMSIGAGSDRALLHVEASEQRSVQLQVGKGVTETLNTVLSN